MPTAAQRASYYRSALTLLRFVEHRAPSLRRFGPEADALWRSFAGALDTGDRIEFLLRDADRQWASAFSPRAAFALPAVHEQDAFGADWAPLPRANAEVLWNESTSAQPASDPSRVLEALWELWELEPGEFELPKITPSSRLVVSGASAVLSVLRRFVANPDLSWPNQVVVIADAPAVRQAAAAAPALVDRREPSVLLSSADVTPELRKAVLAQLGATPEALVSADASPDERAAVDRLSTGWDALYLTAAAQAGYFTTAQAGAAGFSAQLLQKYLQSGRITRAQRGIYRVAHFQTTEHEELMVLWLWSELLGVFSHETALSLHELSDLLPAKVHLTLPVTWEHRRVRIPAGVIVRYSNIEQRDRSWFGAVPLTSPGRTLRDCIAAHVSPEFVEHAIAQARQRGLIPTREASELSRSLEGRE